MHTFVDVGFRALDILMQRNLHADVGLLAQANGQIEAAAAALGMRPEDLVIEFEGRLFRYVKAYPIRPDQPIENTMPGFRRACDRRTPSCRATWTACAQIERFAQYATTGGFKRERKTLPLELIKHHRNKPRS